MDCNASQPPSQQAHPPLVRQGSKSVGNSSSEPVIPYLPSPSTWKETPSVASLVFGWSVAQHSSLSSSSLSLSSSSLLLPQSQTIHLSYFPMPVHVAELSFPINNNNNNNNKERRSQQPQPPQHQYRKLPGVFVASPDTHRIYLYIPKTKQPPHADQDVHNDYKFEKVAFATEGDLPNAPRSQSDPLSFSSPIMSMSSLVVDFDMDDNEECNEESKSKPLSSLHYLTVGCQDGSVHLLTYCVEGGTTTEDEPTFTVLQSHRYIIDGPILSIHCLFVPNKKQQQQPQQNCGEIHLSVGSIRGYACQFRQDVPSGGWKKKESWSVRGPHMIVPNVSSSRPRRPPPRFWNSRLQTEDSVTSVHQLVIPQCVLTTTTTTTTTPVTIVLGTHSGRLSLWETSRPEGSGNGDGESFPFRLLGTYELPLPIHSVATADVDGDGLPELMVTTRKTVHMFRFDTVQMTAERTKQRLRRFVENYRNTKTKKNDNDGDNDDDDDDPPNETKPTDNDETNTTEPAVT